MSRQVIADPYRAALQALNRHGVRYLVVGMSGINYYAMHPAETFATMDYDVFLEPVIPNVERAVQSVQAIGFTVGTTRGMLKVGELAAAVRARKTLVATTPDGLTIDLLLRVCGYPFSALASDAVTFTVRGVPVRVGRLTKLLRSKKLAGRPKDQDFLRRYQRLLEEKPQWKRSRFPFNPSECYNSRLQ